MAIENSNLLDARSDDHSTPLHKVGCLAFQEILSPDGEFCAGATLSDIAFELRKCTF